MGISTTIKYAETRPRSSLRISRNIPTRTERSRQAFNLRWTHARHDVNVMGRARLSEVGASTRDPRFLPGRNVSSATRADLTPQPPLHSWRGGVCDATASPLAIPT